MKVMHYIAYGDPSQLRQFATPRRTYCATGALRDKGQLRSGQRCLVVGASGGVGHLAIQIAKEQGAHVTGVCSTTDVEFVKQLGADFVIVSLRRGSSGVSSTVKQVSYGSTNHKTAPVMPSASTSTAQSSLTAARASPLKY